jgi:DNA-directed RNA polymerase specialized sigma24 family protein
MTKTLDVEAFGEIVPELRAIAGQFRATPAAIDDLVELTLRTAVAEKAFRPRDLPATEWLRQIMGRLVLH